MTSHDAPRRPASVAREDYLQTILQLSEEGVPVIRARLAERLRVSAPSVSEAIRSLADDGLVAIEDRREIRLTADGRHMAENIVRRHRVAERILTDLLGMAWHEAHEEAHRLEHGLSDRVVDAALVALGNPTTCPHGSPIPGTGYVDPHTVMLAEVGEGSSFVVERIGEGIEARPDVMAYLESHGFVPGTRARITSVAPDGARGVAELDGPGSIVVGPDIAVHLHVSLPAAASPVAG